MAVDFHAQIKGMFNGAGSSASSTTGLTSTFENLATDTRSLLERSERHFSVIEKLLVSQTKAIKGIDGFGFSDLVMGKLLSKMVPRILGGLGITAAGAYLKTLFTRGISGVGNVAGTFAKGLGGIIIGSFTSATAGVAKAVRGAGTYLTKGLTSALSIFSTSGLSKIVSGFGKLGGIFGGIGKAASFLPSLAGKLLFPIMALIDGVSGWNNASAGLGREAAGWGDRLVGAIGGILNGFFLGIPDWISQKLGYTGFTQVVDSARFGFINMGQGIANLTSACFNWAMSKLPTLESLKEILPDMGQKVYDLFWGTIDIIQTGFTDMVDGIKDMVKNVFKDMTKGLTDWWNGEGTAPTPRAPVVPGSKVGRYSSGMSVDSGDYARPVAGGSGPGGNGPRPRQGGSGLWQGQPAGSSTVSVPSNPLVPASTGYDSNPTTGSIPPVTSGPNSAVTTAGGKVISTADASLAPQERAFLDTLAVGDANKTRGFWESPDYNTIVGRGGKFDSYADHPRKFGTQTSTAAGRYQFTKTTWDDVRSKYNAENPNNPITDFRPANQDRAALYLAERDYKRRSGGRSLSEDLKSEDPNIGANIKSYLGGSGSNTTWEILQKKSADEIGAAYSSNLERNKQYAASPATPAGANDNRQTIKAGKFGPGLAGIVNKSTMDGMLDKQYTELGVGDGLKKVGNFVARGEQNVDPRLVNILDKAARDPEIAAKYRVEAFSGYRPGDKRNHGRGIATDMRLIDRKTGKALENYQNAESFKAYEEYAQVAKGVQATEYPDMKDFRWGGYFGGAKGKYGAVDTMHFDLGNQGMAGGTWKGGVTDQQKAMFPGLESQGMGDPAQWMAQRRARQQQIASMQAGKGSSAALQDIAANYNWKTTGGSSTPATPTSSTGYEMSSVIDKQRSYSVEKMATTVKEVTAAQWPGETQPFTPAAATSPSRAMANNGGGQFATNKFIGNQSPVAPEKKVTVADVAPIDEFKMLIANGSAVM